MIFEHSSYRTYLSAELLLRAQKNRAYSASAMARQLGLAPSTFHEVIRGRKNLSPTKAMEVARRLGLKSDELEYFCLLTQVEGSGSSKSPEFKHTLLERIRILRPESELRQWDVESFKSIAEWYHLPILALSQVDGFKITTHSAAQALGIHLNEAESALERLTRFQVFERDDTGTYHAIGNRWMAQSGEPNLALRHFHSQMLNKAAESLESQPPKKRFIGSETFGFDPELIPEAEKIAERFFNEMLNLSSRSKKRTQVYHLGVQLFNLTPNLKK